MKFTFILTALISLLGLIVLPACQASVPSLKPIKVLAVESFLADITRQVAGERIPVESLIPSNIDPHAFEATPRDIAKISDSQVIVLNGAGLEEWAKNLLENAGGKNQIVIEASQGLTSRRPQEGERISPTSQPGSKKGDATQSPHYHEGDPHFWLDPNLVVRYVENIREGLAQVDPAGKEVYAQNAAAYIEKLKELDRFIQNEVALIPLDRRLLVTNHESFGYFADRYQFRMIGSIIPSISTGSSPSAQQMAQLVDQIRAYKVKAIFLEAGANPRLAEQIAKETGVKVVSDLFTHSVTGPEGAAPSYIEMMKYNARSIAQNLK